MHRPLLFCLFTAFLAAHAAGRIKIDFHSGADQQAAMDPANPPLQQGTVVKTDAESWNQVPRTFASSGSFSGIALVSADGSASGATLAASYGYAGGKAGGYARTTKDHVMMEGWLGFRVAESLTVANLPAAYAEKFHVIIYGDADNNRTMNYTIGGVTRTIQDSGTFSGDFVEGGNFAIFTGLSGSSFTLTGNANASDFRSAVSGMVIAPGDPPQAPVIVSFSAGDHYVAPGDTVTLSWQVEGAETLSISPGVGPVNGGSAEVVVSETATYTLTAANDDGESTATVRIGAGPPRPNIVVFLVDDMGAQDTSVPFQLDAAGQEIVTPFNQLHRTPGMAALAATGMKFTSAYAMPVCTPTRVSLMTGQNSARHHVTNWTSVGFNGETSNAHPTHSSPANWRRTGLAQNLSTLPQRLQQAGYRTLLAGKAHFGNDEYAGNPHHAGFDVNIGGSTIGHPGSYSGAYGAGGSHAVPHLEDYHNTGTHLSDALTLEMNKAIAKSVEDGAPFFAYMTHYAVHAPFQADPRFTANYPGLSGNALAFATLIEGMDKSLGDIRQKLADLGVAENTLIVFAGDNGSDSPQGAAPLRNIKGSKYEGGVRIPMIASWAARDADNAFQLALPIPAASRATDRVVIYDLHPTLLATAGVSPPEHTLDGRDLSPYLRGEEGNHRPQQLLFHLPHNHRSAFFSTWYDGDWKLIHNYVDGGFELYDLAADPSEANNLAAARPERTIRMARGMARALHEQGAQWPRLTATGADVPFRMPPLAGFDLDGDGISDDQEDINGNGLVDPGETDPDNEDSDGDGTPDGVELRLGTDPLDPSSAFRARLAPEGEGMVLTWPSLPGAFFTIRSSGDLGDWSTIVAENIPAAPAPARMTHHNVDPPFGDRRFFRVLLNSP